VTSNVLGDETVYIYTRERFPKNETFELADKKLFSTIEKEFIKLFGPDNSTSSNVTSSNTTSTNSTSTIKPLNLKSNMTRVSHANCEKLIPDSFDFKKLIPESFTNSTAGNASKEMNEGDAFLRHHHHHHRRHHHHHHHRGWW
jgi:hypothetical protein